MLNPLLAGLDVALNADDLLQDVSHGLERLLRHARALLVLVRQPILELAGDRWVIRAENIADVSKAEQTIAVIIKPQHQQLGVTDGEFEPQVSKSGHDVIQVEVLAPVLWRVE